MKKPHNQNTVVELPFKGSSLILNDMRAMVAQLAVLTERIDKLSEQSAKNTETLRTIEMRTAFLRGSVFALSILLTGAIALVGFILDHVF